MRIAKTISFPNSFKANLKQNKLDTEKGATIVEFAFAGVLFFFLLMGVIDAGMAIYRYAAITYTVSHYAPRHAKRPINNGMNNGFAQFLQIYNGRVLNQSANCEIDGLATMNLNDLDNPSNFIKETFGGEEPKVCFYPRFDRIDIGGVQTLVYRLEGRWMVDCFFCNFFGGFQVKAISEAFVEDRRFDCRAVAQATNRCDSVQGVSF